MKCPAYLCAESDICLLPKYHKLISEMQKTECDCFYDENGDRWYCEDCQYDDEADQE